MRRSVVSGIEGSVASEIEGSVVSEIEGLVVSEIEGSNVAEGMDVPLLCLLYVVLVATYMTG
jgi:hypothetical protein